MRSHNRPQYGDRVELEIKTTGYGEEEWKYDEWDEDWWDDP